MPEERLLSDPYAGIFFSKDRTEQVIETSEESEWIDTSNLPTLAPRSPRDGSTKVRLLCIGEWMNGCPEGSKS